VAVSRPDLDQTEISKCGWSTNTGNFASRDDWTLAPEPSVQANRYTYANAAPLDNTDPTGHAIGAIVQGGMLAAALVGALAVYQAYQENPPTFTWPSWEWSWPWSNNPEISASLPALPTFPPWSPVTPWRGTRGGGGGGGGTVGAPARPGMARPGIARPRPPRPSPAQIQRTLARKARDTYAPRPPSRPGISQNAVNKVRDNAERAVKVAHGAQNTAEVIDETRNALEPKTARPDTTSGDGPSRSDDEDDKSCKPINKYGDLDEYGRPTYINVRFCSTAQLETGSKAGSYRPPGYPKVNPIRPDSRQHTWARCHLRAKSLGGPGKGPLRKQNLFTCLQEPTNNSFMGHWEDKVVDAVDDGEIVDYRVSLVYQGPQALATKIRMEAQGVQRGSGMPGIYFDRCITTGPDGEDRRTRASC